MFFGLCFDNTFVIAAVNVVLPWSTWPIVPMFTCGLLRSNFSLLILCVFSGRNREYYKTYQAPVEPKAGFEPATSSLPRMRSTPELLGHEACKNWSGRRDSNSRHSAWKADALPTELLPR